LCRIFGGALRDIICGDSDDINDIDILIGARTFKLVRDVLIENGYKHIESIVKKDIERIYSINRVINEPHIYMKGLKMVQLIRPVDNIGTSYKESLIDLIKNVDISSCGISWDGSNLYENYPNSIIHAKNKIFYVNDKAKMHTSRINVRVNKLLEKGWKIIEVYNKQVMRDQIIDNVLSVEEYNLPKYIAEFDKFE
jgi:hypothetical protein